jgi:hypothetical protein
VVEAAGADGVDERFGDVFLADDFGEGLRPVFAVQRECHVILLLTGLLGLMPGYGLGPTFGGATAGLGVDGTAGCGRCRLVARIRGFRASEGVASFTGKRYPQTVPTYLNVSIEG